MGVVIVSLFKKLTLIIHRGQEFTQDFNTMTCPGTVLSRMIALLSLVC